VPARVSAPPLGGDHGAEAVELRHAGSVPAARRRRAGPAAGVERSGRCGRVRWGSWRPPRRPELVAFLPCSLRRPPPLHPRRWHLR
jgi:hypothetical protein